MVAPLIVGASRVIAGGSRATTARAGKRSAGKAQTQRQGDGLTVRKRDHQKVRNDRTNARKEAYDQLRKDGYIGRKNDRYTEKGRALLNSSSEKKEVPEGVVKKIETATKIARAGTAAGTIFWTAIGFYVPQLGFWLLGIAGLGLEITPVINYVIPGNTLFVASYVVITLIGVSTMAYAALVFTIRGVPCFGGWKGLIFAGCLTAYLVLFINFFPWFIIWLASVILLQSED